MIDHVIGDWLIQITDNNAPLFFILGPCAIESEQHCLMMAEHLKNLSKKLNFKLIFKAAFDKANRTSLQGFRGIGLEEGLRILKRVRDEFHLPILTDIHESWQAAVAAEVVDILQIPAFLCRQTDLLVAAGKTGKVIHIKKGQFVRAEKMSAVVEKIASTGNQHVWLCERGYTFGYEDLIVDYRNFSIMKRTTKPVVFDATHSVQRPGQLGPSTGGDRQYVASLAAAAVVQGIAGIFMEVHDHPEQAKSDGPNSIRLSQLEELVSYLMTLDQWTKQRPIPQVS